MRGAQPDDLGGKVRGRPGRMNRAGGLAARTGGKGERDGFRDGEDLRVGSLERQGKNGQDLDQFYWRPEGG
jgi:hypothetical protein